ncbi:hypothetical protein [Isoptericola sp. NPDC019482]|uniref:hypothetical protein n=1 Tax=Isoptericola sp. NPDC019482 TaxID=3154688 RepID=UPI0034937208
MALSSILDKRPEQEAAPEAAPAPTLPPETAPTAPTLEPQEPRSEGKPAQRKPARAPQRKATRKAPPQPTAADGEPKYLTLERKEARIRGDQAEELTVLRRRLNKARSTRGGERITENTLIRVAIDLLLERSGELGGDDEDQLRASVGL